MIRPYSRTVSLWEHPRCEYQMTRQCSRTFRIENIRVGSASGVLDNIMDKVILPTPFVSRPARRSLQRSIKNREIEMLSHMYSSLPEWWHAFYRSLDRKSPSIKWMAAARGVIWPLSNFCSISSAYSFRSTLFLVRSSMSFRRFFHIQ